MSADKDFYMEHLEKIALFTEEWTAEAEAFLLKEKCENAEFLGTFRDFSFLPSCGQSLRRIRVSNYSEKIGYLTKLKDLKNLFVNFSTIMAEKQYLEVAKEIISKLN